MEINDCDTPVIDEVFIRKAFLDYVPRSCMYKEVKLHNESEQYILIQEGEVRSHIELWVCDKETQQPPLYLTKDEALQLSNELKIFAENYTGYER